MPKTITTPHRPEAQRPGARTIAARPRRAVRNRRPVGTTGETGIRLHSVDLGPWDD